MTALLWRYAMLTGIALLVLEWERRQAYNGDRWEDEHETHPGVGA